MERMFEYTTVSEMTHDEAPKTNNLRLTAEYLRSLSVTTIEEKIKMALFDPSSEAG